VIQKYDLTPGENWHLKELLSTIFRLKRDLHTNDLNNQAAPTVNSLYIPREHPATQRVILHTRQINLQLSRDAFAENICHRSNLNAFVGALLVEIYLHLRSDDLLCWHKGTVFTKRVISTDVTRQSVHDMFIERWRVNKQRVKIMHD